MSSDYPPTLANLNLHDFDHNPSIYATLKSIRKATLSIPNRLQSILSDASFAKSISQEYDLPLVANERCGSWYIKPSDKIGSAYFKSTDGHHGQWNFSLRRLNLQLLPILGSHGGAVVVDSTRRGKSLPDSFSKTVPIWVAVINRVLFPGLKYYHALQHPPAPESLGLSEISQIEAKLDDFAQSFTQLGLDLSMLRTQLKFPIHIIWEFNGRSGFGIENDEDDEDTWETELCSTSSEDRHVNNLVLCSASRRVRGAEASEGGYIQGAGDDSEGWSHGLTAQTFWNHQSLLMHTPEEQLEALIETLSQQDEDETRGEVTAVRISPTTQLFIGAGYIGKAHEYDLVVNSENSDQDQDQPTGPNVLNLKCRSGKLGSKDLRENLPIAATAISTQLRKDSSSRILVTCATGRDLSVGVIVAVLCVEYNDRGELSQDSVSRLIDKSLVKQRLAWITSSKPDANPSRATLQAVNSFLMRRPD
ncbi:hypothetical protein LTR84_002659 [Exophiala bonariae]|uniref:Initiator tRNA phosphoribosyl transferase n=1 Tax=Exophiala bonariae TaxID=1690606 RepID=A0AAV9N9A7_9EURO|nr:hypothetical protein LTR84_002659 [Exophiala bonariae]